ncbi:hypothetical protein PR001_g23198 [Phytophthora rubi]|uniref:DDE Tnp4 domain-containing protein n=1 Tax=Phytophthora rubi TaxID=129364 RepID=A0A6A3IVE8_9STRA|nr:hypothetical protein PR002_g23348 [Phytophthora rubi]KAE8984355.1 hypothetical protein PR001_g23198 [Phytophthora rubi]
MPRARAPRELTEEAAEQGVARLTQLNEARQAKRARCAPAARSAVSAVCETVDLLSPLFDRFQLNGEENVMQTINFSAEEFNRLRHVLEEYVVLRWNVGRGKKCKFGGKDVLLMVLASLKHCGKWDIVASVFDINPPTFQKMVLK